MSDNRPTAWEAQARQADMISCPCFEIFFGGARGGGKTDAMLGDFIEHGDSYGDGAIGLMIRRQRTELTETIERSKQIYGLLGWKFNEQEKMWRAPNGARLRFAYLERDGDADAYLGHSYSRLYVEEIGSFPDPKPVFKLMSTLRSGSGVPVGFRATGNPGGPGHAWVKARYIDPCPGGWREIMDPNTGLMRIYIPSRVTDNKYLGDGYVNRIKASGSEQLVKAWLYGDWSAIEGAFFGEWSNEKHVVAPFRIPGDWTRFRSGDWGSYRPFAFHWWAVAGDDFATGGNNVLARSANGQMGSVPKINIPRGSIVCYREYYGGSAPNVGLKLPAETVAQRIRMLEAGDGEIAYGVIDPSTFSSDGGPSIAERLWDMGRGVSFRRADNTRIAHRGAMGGWDQLRARLIGEHGSPTIYFFDTCVNTIRTIPALQHDAARPEDVNTEGDDHCADSVRYACSSRPYMTVNEPKPAEKAIVIGGLSSVTLDDVVRSQQPYRTRERI